MSSIDLETAALPPHGLGDAKKTEPNHSSRQKLIKDDLVCVEQTSNYQSCLMMEGSGDACAPILRSSKKYSDPKKKRLLSKDGDIMVEVRNIHAERWRFFEDLFTSLIHLKWRWVLFLFCASYVAAWLFFGCLWALLVVAYGPGYCVDKVWTVFYFWHQTVIKNQIKPSVAFKVERFKIVH